uniref:Uncharacterized protein n=1 Tax=Melopsittacus undulatus TaxID=13146 RepID=A0A8V5FWD2_MELUD
FVTRRRFLILNPGGRRYCCRAQTPHKFASVPTLSLEKLHNSVLGFLSFPGVSINGSAIENFSCVIYNISFMNCTWQAGKDAPGDTQYFLYWQNSRYDDVKECELYIKDENGRNTGCRFQNVRIETEKAYFLVNGSSKDSLIQFYDVYIQLYKIEKLMPPENITVNCDEIKSNCIIQWQRPQISHSNKDKCFKYKIDIKYKVREISLHLTLIHTFTKAHR